jgi:uncharacterized membrane protein
MKKLARFFLQGILYLAPITVTAYIILLIFNFVDGILEDFLFVFLDLSIPGLGIIILIIVLTVVGYLGQTIIATPIKRFTKRIIESVPILNVVYSAFSDLFSAFVGKEKKFNKPVMVLVNPISNLEKIGFLTENDLRLLGEKEKVAVYFPHSYNFSGELFIVPVNQVRSLNVNAGDIMKFVVSGGVAGLHETADNENHHV